MVAPNHCDGNRSGADAHIVCRIAQCLVCVATLTMLGLLVVAPRTGLHAMWDVILPIAPALMAVAPGLWRNLCPLGITAQLPRNLGISAARRLTERGQVAMQTTGVALLFVILPLRHVSLNADAGATLATLLVAGGAALAGGLLFSGKSGWCTGPCPVHAVEKLYGQRPPASIWNAHCRECVRCTAICPDSTKAMEPLIGKGHPARVVAGWLLIGGFPGFIWGWFHVADYSALSGEAAGRWAHLADAYATPLMAMAVSLGIYVVFMKLLPRDARPIIGRVFAATAITVYYWYRLPMLLGLGIFPDEGVLLDLRTTMFATVVLPVQLAVAIFWGWWFIAPNSQPRVWEVRPTFAPEIKKAGPRLAPRGMPEQPAAALPLSRGTAARRR